VRDARTSTPARRAGDDARTARPAAWRQQEKEYTIMLHPGSKATSDDKYLAQFPDEYLLEGLARLFRETKRQLCRKCGRESLHRTCDDCRAKARTIVDIQTNKARRTEGQRYARLTARRSA
jgi:hypothetical protein